MANRTVRRSSKRSTTSTRIIGNSSKRRRSSHWRPAGRRGSIARRAATRPASCAWPMKRRCSFPTGAATTASIHYAIIISDPRVALLFLIPGVGETIRVIGRAGISTDPALTESFIVNGKTPRTVIVVAVERVFYQCTKAIVRSRLWDPALHVDRTSLPSAGTILAEISRGKIGGPEHDRAQPQRIKETLY